jgi:hypothetical protein
VGTALPSGLLFQKWHSLLSLWTKYFQNLIGRVGTKIHYIAVEELGDGLSERENG